MVVHIIVPQNLICCLTSSVRLRPQGVIGDTYERFTVGQTAFTPNSTYYLPDDVSAPSIVGSAILQHALQACLVSDAYQANQHNVHLCRRYGTGRARRRTMR